MDKASAHGAGDCRFESYQDQRRPRLRGQAAAAKVVISQVEAVKNELQFGDESPRVSSLGLSEYEARSAVHARVGSRLFAPLCCHAHLGPC